MSTSVTWDAYFGHLRLPNRAVCTPEEVIRWAWQQPVSMRNAAAYLMSWAYFQRSPHSATSEELPPGLFLHAVTALQEAARAVSDAQGPEPGEVLAPVACPQCTAAARSSPVYQGCEAITAMGFTPRYDTKGRRHAHDPNQITTVFACGNGHLWLQTRHRTRCWCGWPEATAADVAWPIPALSTTERALLQAVVQGQSDEDIARAQGRSSASVRTDIATICKNFGVLDRTQAVVWALGHGLIEQHIPSDDD